MLKLYEYKSRPIPDISITQITWTAHNQLIKLKVFIQLSVSY